MPYIYALLILPSDTPRWLSIALGFLLGLTVDIFTNTPGLAAAVCTADGLFFPLFLRLYGPKDYDEKDSLRPNAHSMEWGPFLRYAATGALFHTLLFFIIEAFSFFSPIDILINFLSSSALTVLFIAALELLRNEK